MADRLSTSCRLPRTSVHAGSLHIRTFLVRAFAVMAFLLQLGLATDPFATYAQGTEAPAAIQDSTATVEIEMRDGNIFIGIILSDDGEHIVIRTRSLGVLTIRHAEIRRIAPIQPTQVRDGEVWHRSAHDTRYFFQSNAYNLRKGEGYYQNAWVFFNQVSYGITKQFSLGTGFIPTFLFAEPATPVWITPKLSIPVKHDHLTLGVGGLTGVVLGESSAFGIIYSNLTLGDRDRNLTFAGGFGYAEGEVEGDPLLGLAGSWRVRPKLAVMTENYMFADQILSFIGFRHIGRKVAIDGALLVPVGEEIAVPWVSITAPFLTKRAD
jgi:hypothetical protein